MAHFAHQTMAFFTELQKDNFHGIISTAHI